MGAQETELTQHELVKRELARRNYRDYLRYVNPTWVDTRFSTFIANTIQDFVEEDTGNPYDILILESPPQHGKSMTVTESFPSWYLGRYPQKRAIEVSYNDDTATRFLRANKSKVKQYGKILFNISIGGADRADIFELSSGGSMLSRGVMSGITGNPADLMIIDDPIKNRQEADSETTRQSIWNEWLNSMKSRLQARSKVILIMTPWHEDDLRARLMETEEYCTRIRLPVEAEEDDPLGREPGEPLCPELGKDSLWLEAYKKSYLNDDQGGPRAWSALYMCNPVVEGGNMVCRDWWKFYDPDLIDEFGTEVISVDAAFKDGDSNDFVSIQVWGKLNGCYYLRYNCKEHLDFPGTVRRIQAVRHMFPSASRIYIEDKANGSAIIQVLQRQMSNVIPVNPLGGKVARVNAVSPFIEVGHVFLPSGMYWLEDYLREWSEFPAGKHDDQVDATTQALSQLQFAWDKLEDPEAGQSEADRVEEEKVLFSLGDYNPYGDYTPPEDLSDSYDPFGWFDVY